VPAVTDTLLETPRTDTDVTADFAARCRLVTRLLIGFLAMSLVLAVVTFVLRDHVQSMVWGRVIGLMVASPLYLFFANRMAAGRRWAYVRLKVLSVIGTIGITLLVSLPGPYPVWMRIEQGAQGILLVVLAAVLTRPAIKARFRKPAR
jgi:hypothetical protein